MVARETHQQGPRLGARTNGRLGPGQAPPVGIRNAERARENLKAKLIVIEAWVKEFLASDCTESVEPLIPLNALPRSQRDFNAWESEDLPISLSSKFALFHKNGNATLLKNSDLLEVLVDYFKILRKAEAADPARRKKESVASLHRRLAMEKTLRRIAEKELVRARAQVWKSHQEQELLRAEVRSADAKAAEIIEELEAMLQQVTSERADLANALKKVAGIRLANK